MIMHERKFEVNRIQQQIQKRIRFTCEKSVQYYADSDDLTPKLYRGSFR